MVDRQPVSATTRPQPTASAHAACVAALRAAWWPCPAAIRALTPVATRLPMTATPSSEPICLVAEMTADATPACSAGMPAMAAPVIGGLTRPRPAPVTARASAR